MDKEKKSKDGKVGFKAGTMLNPLPVVMVSCGDRKENYNIITIAWTGILNSEPPITYVSIRKSRHSHSIVKETGEFVINLCNKELAFATDYCGVKSGRDVDKFEVQGLTAIKSEKVCAPAIKEAPVSLECKVLRVIELPSHDVFMAEIVNVRAEESLMDENGRLRLDKAQMLSYMHGEYFAIESKPLGRFGYSVMKPKTRKKINREKRKK